VKPGGRALLTTGLAKGFALPLQEVQVQLITAQLADVPSEDKVWRACRSVKVGVLLANFQMEIRQNLETNARFFATAAVPIFRIDMFRCGVGCRRPALSL
jgi:hypothetical protein